MTLTNKALENTVGKEENAGDQHFLHFPQWFLLYQREKSSLLLQRIRHLQMFSIFKVQKSKKKSKEQNLYFW